MQHSQTALPLQGILVQWMERIKLVYGNTIALHLSSDPVFFNPWLYFQCCSKYHWNGCWLLAKRKLDHNFHRSQPSPRTFVHSLLSHQGILTTEITSNQLTTRATNTKFSLVACLGSWQTNTLHWMYTNAHHFALLLGFLQLPPYSRPLGSLAGTAADSLWKLLTEALSPLYFPWWLWCYKSWSANILKTLGACRDSLQGDCDAATHAITERQHAILFLNHLLHK